MEENTPTPRQLFYHHSNQLERWEMQLSVAESDDDKDEAERAVLWHENMCRKYSQMMEAERRSRFDDYSELSKGQRSWTS